MESIDIGGFWGLCWILKFVILGFTCAWRFWIILIILGISVIFILLFFVFTFLYVLGI